MSKREYQHQEAMEKAAIDMSKFTEKWRVKHSEPLNYNERIVNSACDIIDQQEKRIKELEITLGEATIDLAKAILSKAERINELEAKLKQHRWIPVSEKLPEKGKCLVLCEGKIYEVKVRISEDEWEDNEGKSFMQETVCCDIRGLGCILIGHDECITHWKKP